MQIETAGMLRCCQKVAATGGAELQASARSVQSYMMHKIMDRFIDLPDELEVTARQVIEAAMEADDG